MMIKIMHTNLGQSSKSLVYLFKQPHLQVLSKTRETLGMRVGLAVEGGISA